MCYHPKLRTAFFDAAEKAGWMVLPGTESIIYQAVAQQVLWTELPLETFKLDEVKRVVSEELLKH
jgi:quinate dehydrogenase